LKAERLRTLALFALAVGIRLLYICPMPETVAIGSTDAWGYHRLALNLNQGNGFSLQREAPYLPDSVRTPLYPAFLWLIRQAFGPSPRTAAVSQALLDGLTTLLTRQIAARLGGLRAGRVAGLLYALNPTQVRYAGELLTETLLSFLLALCILCLIEYLRRVSTAPSPVTLLSCSQTTVPGVARRTMARPALPARTTLWTGLIGAFGGLAALCKPNVQFLPLVWLLVVCLARRKDWRRAATDAAAMLGVFLLLILPWVVRNRLVFGRWFFSAAFEGNVSRVSAPAALLTARGEYAIPWSEDWEAAFGEIVAQTAARYNWSKPWDALTARELDTANHQVYLIARQVLRRHPAAWLVSHVQGMGRYLEPQTYRVCYARFSGQEWPPHILDDAVIHVIRALGRADWAQAGQIISEERWSKLDPLQGLIWWATFAGQILGLVLVYRGARRLSSRPVLLVALLLTIGYVLWIPGPIAYERFRVPVTSPILALLGTAIDSPRRSPIEPRDK
jgi:4-amino-4-deoxy-L-arabinose transferase-like glycosyltransferase